MAQEDFNINNIYANLNRTGGLLHPCNFLVLVTAPRWLKDTLNNPAGTATIQSERQFNAKNNETLSIIPYFCFSASLPGISFNSTQIRRSGYGPMEKRPVEPSFPDVSLSYFSDSEASIMKFFTAWMQNISNFENRGGMNKSVNGMRTFESQFPEMYETTIQIFQYNTIGNKVIVYTLNNAFPSSVSETPLDWGRTNTYNTVNVNFKYRTWSSDALNPGTYTVTSLTYENLLTDPIAAAVYAYNTIKSPELLADFIATQLRSFSYIPLNNVIGMNILTRNITGLI